MVKFKNSPMVALRNGIILPVYDVKETVNISV